MRLQGAISPRVEARLDELLGHPETCPHGNPIDAATAKRRPAGRAPERDRGRRPGPRSTASPRRPRRTPACCPISRPGRSSPGAPVTVLARSESLDSLTLEGPLGRATLGLRPAALVRVLRGRRRPGALPPRARIGHPVVSEASTPRPRDRRSRPDRAQPDRAAPHRHRPDRALQLPARPARRRARSSCASRTPTSRAARSSSRRTSSTGCTGWG